MRHPYVTTPDRPFLGDFDLLPLAAHLQHGAVPTHPTSDDFQLTAARLGDSSDAASLWHLEAVRERRLNPGRPLEDAKKDINRRVAARLHEICTN